MDFREYAAKEASGSIRRVLAGSAEACRQQVAAVRAALDAAGAALETALDPAQELDQDLVQLVDRLTAAATEAAEQAARTVSEQAQTVHDALRAELQARVDEKDALASSLDDAQAHNAALRAELNSATERADAISHELAQVRDALARLEAVRHELTHAHDNEMRARIAAEQERDTTRDMIVASRDDLALVTKKFELVAEENARLEEATSAAQSQAQAAEAKLAAVTDLFKASAARVKVLERAQADHDATIAELDQQLRIAAATNTGRTASLSVFDDLLSGFQALAASKTIADALATLMEQLAAQFSRVALFRVKSNHLQGEHQIGFDLKTDIGKLVLPRGMDSVLTRAVSSGRVERLSESELADGSGAPFSGSPTSALALPVVVDHETLAVIYADDAGVAADEREPDAPSLAERFAEAMLQHTVALLMRLTTELRTRAELRAYAESLLQEIQQMYEADVAAGKTGDDLQSRAKANLDYARSIFMNRVELEGADAAGLLDDLVVAYVDAQPSSPFGKALGVLAGRTPGGEARHAAEAS